MKDLIDILNYQREILTIKRMVLSIFIGRHVICNKSYRLQVPPSLRKTGWGNNMIVVFRDLNSINVLTSKQILNFVVKPIESSTVEYKRDGILCYD